MTNERINKVLAELKEYGQMKKELDSQIKALQDECKVNPEFISRRHI